MFLAHSQVRFWNIGVIKTWSNMQLTWEKRNMICEISENNSTCLNVWYDRYGRHALYRCNRWETKRWCERGLFNSDTVDAFHYSLIGEFNYLMRNRSLKWHWLLTGVHVLWSTCDFTRNTTTIGASGSSQAFVFVCCRCLWLSSNSHKAFSAMFSRESAVGCCIS